MLYINLIIIFFILIILLRSLSNLFKLFGNLHWLYDGYSELKECENIITYPNFVICIPVLREQDIIEKKINYFSKLKYPKNKYQIIITTTEKETFDKMKNKKKLESLAKDLSAGINLRTILDTYLGIFTNTKLKHIYKKFQKLDFNTILNNLMLEFDNYPTTYALAHNYAQLVNQKIGFDFTKVLHYPDNNGLMSHQINYTIEKFRKLNDNFDTFFAVYNADSRPNEDTLLFVARKIQEMTNEGLTVNILQQSSLFTLNYNSFPNTLKGLILKSAAIFQTKWTLVHELNRFRTQSKNAQYINRNLIDVSKNIRLSHCVGHGLFIRLTTLTSNNSIPTETITEDLPFGYYACCKGEAIHPIPILENSDSPLTLDSLINQKRVWFSPYLEYMKCRKKVLMENKFRNKLEVDFLTIQGIWTGFIWLIQSFIFIIPLVLAIATFNMPLIAIWIFSLFLYWYLPVFIIYKNLDKLEMIAGKRQTTVNFIDYFIVSTAGIVVIFTHSIGPLLRTIDFLKKILFNIEVKKNKTER
jgi:hypothetical protein